MLPFLDQMCIQNLNAKNFHHLLFYSQTNHTSTKLTRCLRISYVSENRIILGNAKDMQETKTSCSRWSIKKVVKTICTNLIHIGVDVLRAKGGVKRRSRVQNSNQD